MSYFKRKFSDRVNKMGRFVKEPDSKRISWIPIIIPKPKNPNINIALFFWEIDWEKEFHVHGGGIERNENIEHLEETMVTFHSRILVHKDKEYIVEIKPFCVNPPSPSKKIQNL